MSVLRSWKVAVPVGMVAIIVGILVVGGGDDADAPTAGETSEASADASSTTAGSAAPGATTEDGAPATVATGAPATLPSGSGDVPVATDATGATIVPADEVDGGGSGSGSNTGGNSSGGNRATTTVARGATTTVASGATTTVAGAATTTTIAGVTTTTTAGATTTLAPGATTTTLAPVPTLDPDTTIPAGEAGLRVEPDGCFVTVQVDAEDAGTAVVRMSGPVVDRAYLMAIEDGTAEVGIRLTTQVVGAYRFDVTVTGVSSAVSASVTEDIDCRP